MLPVSSRVSSREEHARIGREGRRFSCPPLIVHVLSTPDTGPARAGFVVSRKVGPAVTRNRVRRRLREQTRSRLAAMPPGTLLVIRALPESAEASSAELGGALDRGLTAARTRPSHDRPPRGRTASARRRSTAGRSGGSAAVQADGRGSAAERRAVAGTSDGPDVSGLDASRRSSR